MRATLAPVRQILPWRVTGTRSILFTHIGNLVVWQISCSLRKGRVLALAVFSSLFVCHLAFEAPCDCSHAR